MFTDLWQMIRAARANTVNLGVPRNVYFKMEDEVFVVSSVAQMESPVHPLPSQSELATAVSKQRLSRSSAEGIHGVHLRGRDERNETLWHGGVHVLGDLRLHLCFGARLRVSRHEVRPFGQVAYDCA